MPLMQEYNKDTIKESIYNKLLRYYGVTLEEATPKQIYAAVASTVRDQIMLKWRFEKEERFNSKMDEVRSAYGLLNLQQVDDAIEKRHQVAIRYREALRNIPGIRFFDDMPGVRHNYSYFPIFINAEEYGKSRDRLYFEMKEKCVLGRRYFFPLISSFSTYRGLHSATPENLPVATRIANEVICLPMHHELSEEDIERTINCIIPT